MLSHIIELSVKNRVLVLLVTALVAGAGTYALLQTPVDALPDLSDVQVIVYADYPGQSPRTVEDQVTYPLTAALVSVPGSRVVRGYSFFGYSLVYVIFEDGTDLYWARSRVAEYLSYAQRRLPRSVVPSLGPDATGLGWVFEYTVTSDQRSLAELRSLQDWFLKYQLSSVPGVAEVASIGGFVKQYQVNVDPAKLVAYGIPLSQVRGALERSNADVGGETLELGEAEFMVRGLGYLRSVEDIGQVAVSLDLKGTTPVYLRDVAQVLVGPLMRRGLTEANGQGEVVTGIVVMRTGQNALQVIDGVKRKLAEIRSGLPADVKLTVAYDRSGLIRRAIENLQGKLLEECLIVALVAFVFLLHVRSALVAIITLPTAILIAFGVMRVQGLNANIMSLGGIAIAIGAMVDAAIIMIENAHRHLERESSLPKDERRPHWEVISRAAREVGPSLFYSLLVITVSFLPVFTLQAQEGRLFRPLAFTKTWSMAAAALLSVTLVPVLMGYWIRGRIRPEEKNPVNRALIGAYHPVVRFVLAHGKAVLIAALLIIALTAIPFLRLGSEFMPPLYEGDILYMPTTLPGISITRARQLLQQTDAVLARFPEVEHVLGKAGRADTATDPAGLDMFETTLRLKPRSQWRRGMTPEKLVAEMDEALRFPGLTNSWTMPIRARTDMLTTGIRTPVGVKLAGPDLATLENLGQQVEAALRPVRGTSSVFAERTLGGNYLDLDLDREAVARYGLTTGDVQDVIETAVGGMTVTTTVEGLERYPVNVRYPRELRDSPERLAEVLVFAPNGAQVPLGQLARFSFNKGPMVVRTEATRPQAWVYVDIAGTDVGSYVERAKEAVAEKVQLPPGYTLTWSGQFEYLQRSGQRLLYVIPATVFIIFLILYLNTRSFTKTAMVLLAVPFSLVGAVWLLFLSGYNLSIAVWVGMIALAGLDAETGVVMLLYLDVAYEERRRAGTMRTLTDLREAIDHGAVRRVRPKIMTAATIIAGLLPILWSGGAGSDVMKRIATPMVGGVVTSVLLELAVYPVLYYFWRGAQLRKQALPPRSNSSGGSKGGSC
ncbi:MAG: efflux RND transporter permease subunit [Myxococcaceae bacterium]